MRLGGKVPPAKVSAAEQLAKDVSAYKVVATADLVKVRSSQVQETRRKLRGRVKVLVTKNMLFKKAAESVEGKKKNISTFANSLSGPNLFLFTEIDPFELTILLDKSKVRVPAKMGDVATGEILVPAGNTGLPPGPIISEFNEAKILTKIESGSIWVTKDTVVANKGDVISAKVASVLSKLGIKPIEAGISLKAAYDAGSIFNRDDLQLDLKTYRDDIAFAAKQALGLALEANYLTPETAPIVLSRVQRQAMWLAVKSQFPATMAMPEILRETFLEMKALSTSVASINKEAAPSSYEAPAPAQVVAPKMESIVLEVEPPKKEKPVEVKVRPAPTPPSPPKVEAPPKIVTPPKRVAPPKETKPIEVKPPEPVKPVEKKVVEEPKPAAKKKPTAAVKESKPKKKTGKEKVEKKEKAKREKTRSR
jgi:large subunit ribosomal protein L10